MYAPDAIEVEFIAASGRTQALVTLHPKDVREVADSASDGRIRKESLRKRQAPHQGYKARLGAKAVEHRLHFEVNEEP